MVVHRKLTPLPVALVTTDSDWWRRSLIPSYSARTDGDDVITEVAMLSDAADFVTSY